MTISKIAPETLIAFRRLFFIVVFGAAAFLLLIGLYEGILFYQDAQYKLHHEPGDMGNWCGNSYSDPLDFGLNVVVPVGASASIGLFFLAWMSYAKWRRVITTSCIFFLLCLIIVELTFYVFRVRLHSGPVNIVWWLPSIRP